MSPLGVERKLAATFAADGGLVSAHEARRGGHVEEVNFGFLSAPFHRNWAALH